MMEKEQVTKAGGNNQLLYFTSTSLPDGEKGLAYIGDRTGHPNIYFLDFLTGEERQLTFQKEGWLKSYVYFDGTPYCGFGKASVSLHPASGEMYYIQGRDIASVKPDGSSRILAQLPQGQMTGFTHVSKDGSRLCVPTVDAAAFDVTGDLGVEIDKKVQKDHLCSWLRVFDTKTGEQLLCEPVPHAWVTHVQFSPTDNNAILYNHEWTSHSCGIRRMWLWDGQKHIPLRIEGENRSKEDWVCHEMWEKDGEHVIYHGGYKNGTCFVGRVNTDTMENIEVPISEDYKSYGHFTVGDTGVLTSDGYYTEEALLERDWGGRWISLQKVDWEKGQIKWVPLCLHGSNWDCQCSHPHPIFDSGDKNVYFTSNESGFRQVYRVKTGL